MQIHGPREAVELPRAEVAFLVSARDADDDVVARVGGRGSDAEDLSWDDDVGLEAQLVVRDAQRHGLALLEVGATYSLAASKSMGDVSVLVRNSEGVLLLF